MFEMTASQFLTALVTVIYAGVAISHFMSGRYPMAFIFVGYSIANVGLIFAERQA